MFRRCTEIAFEGFNVNRTLNILSQKYVVYDVFRSGKTCRITVPTADYLRVVAYLQEKCYNITEIRKQGCSFVLEFFRRHFLLPIFLLLAVAVLAISANFCWKIEVAGDFAEEEVLQAMRQCDIGIGTSLWKFRADVLENRLATELDAMYAVVNRRGSTLYVDAVKKKVTDSPIDMHSRRDIFAIADGKVTYLLCEQGTAAVKVGETVKKGDLLIAGVRTFNDGTSTDVYALGKVVVQLSRSAFAKFDGTCTETVETGNIFTSNCVVLFGKEYGSSPPFESFRRESVQTKLFPLNLTVQHITYYETQQVTRQATLEECLEELKKRALADALQKADFEVKYTQYTVTDTGVNVTVYGETEIY